MLLGDGLSVILQWGGQCSSFGGLNVVADSGLNEKSLLAPSRGGTNKNQTNI